MTTHERRLTLARPWDTTCVVGSSCPRGKGRSPPLITLPQRLTAPGQAGHAKTHLLDNAFETSEVFIAGLDGLVEPG
jgi:hypothetical protein